jgi:MFS family permease
MHTSNAADTPTAKASPVEAWVLIATSWLSVAAAQVIAPVLPKIADAFGAEAQVGKLIPLLATLPALFVALLAAPAGLLADRVGHRRILIVGLAIYGIFGVAPALMHSLPWIVATRAAVGISEAAIMTCSTALLAAAFSHQERAKWLAYQTGSANVIAVVFVLGSGFLGEGSWRTPFWIYLIGLALVPAVLLTVGDFSGRRNFVNDDLTDRAGSDFDLRLLLGICAVTVFASTAFFVLIIQQSFLLTQRGFASTRLIGLSAAIISLAVPVGSAFFRWFPMRIERMLAISFILSSIGFAIVSSTSGYAAFLVGGAINGVGSGIVLPALITWALSHLSARVRGFGTGMWQSSFFLGTFLSPLIILWLSLHVGGLSGAVRMFALFCAIAAVIAIVSSLMIGRARPTVV